MTPPQRLYVDENHDVVPPSKALYLVEIVRDAKGALVKETWLQIKAGEVPGPRVALPPPTVKK